jgi:hypothetical protein
MNIQVNLARPGDAVLVNKKWVILDTVINTIPAFEERSTQLRGRHVSNGKVVAVDLTVPSDWTITVNREASAEAPPSG